MVTRQESRFVVFQCTFCLGLIMSPMLAALNISKQLLKELKENEGRWMRILILIILDIRDQLGRKWSPLVTHRKGRSSNSTLCLLFWRSKMDRTWPGLISLQGSYFSLFRPLVWQREGLGNHEPGLEVEIYWAGGEHFRGYISAQVSLPMSLQAAVSRQLKLIYLLSASMAIFVRNLHPIPSCLVAQRSSDPKLSLVS